jgi:nucleoid DNA-binding protein
VTHRETISYIASRLPHQSRRDVAEILDLLYTLWTEQLSAGEAVNIPSVGRLSIETQDLKPSGFVKKQSIRLYGRFCPTGKIRRTYIKERT